MRSSCLLQHRPLANGHRQAFRQTWQHERMGLSVLLQLRASALLATSCCLSFAVLQEQAALSSGRRQSKLCCWS